MTKIVANTLVPAMPDPSDEDTFHERTSKVYHLDQTIPAMIGHLHCMDIFWWSQRRPFVLCQNSIPPQLPAKPIFVLRPSLTKSILIPHACELYHIGLVPTGILPHSNYICSPAVL